MEAERWRYLAGMYDPVGPTARAYRDGHLQTVQSELSGALTASSPPYNWFWYVGVENNTNSPLDELDPRGPGFRKCAVG